VTPISVRIEHWLRRRSQFILVPIARFMGRVGLTPNALTGLGLLLNIGVAAVLARGATVLGGWLLLGASAFDALDGTLARLTDRQSEFGAFLDSTIDRYSEAFAYGGLLLHYLEQDARVETVLVYVAIIGSLMVSYSRARSEGVGVACQIGIAPRWGRVCLIAVGLILNQATLALWAVAILANLTAIQRIVHVWRQTQGKASITVAKREKGH
jgi:CDP-diacylglycerol--glycerol-3-phosphate 3-phosphatidyltransferase